MKTIGRVLFSELTAKDLFGVFISIGIVLISFFTMPTFADKGYSLTIKNLYENNSLLYTIIMIVINILFSLFLYFSIKTLYIIKFKDYLYRNEMFNKYIDFLSDAKQVWIFAGDLDFLKESNDQLLLIKKLGKNCKILCEKVDNTEKEIEIVEIYKMLEDAKIQIRSYPTEIKEKISNFRGQIRINSDSTLEHLFMKQEKEFKKYFPIDIENQFVTELIKDEFERNFEKGENPLIKHIIFDLGGVYFDGDFLKDFLDVINKKLKIRINYQRRFKLLLDEDLNLGNITIVQWVQKNIKRELTEEENQFITKIWRGVW